MSNKMENQQEPEFIQITFFNKKIDVQLKNASLESICFTKAMTEIMLDKEITKLLEKFQLGNVTPIK